VEDYDAWYDSPEGRALFDVEVECLRPLVASCPSPRLEVGVGTGRFARALHIECGIDRASAPLAKARERGVASVRADAQSLPIREASVGGVVFVMTLCFVSDPALALREARRILAPGGRLVIATIALESPWGEAYERAAREGHPFYRHARLRSIDQLREALAADWEIERTRSALCEPPGSHFWAPPREGFVAGAGFVALSARATPTPAGSRD
jgi:ubiquinone/menaquinone biosynthesis C-methylase UbiE